MAVLGFTTTSSLIKNQAEMVKNKGLEAFGVSVIDDLEGKHDVIKSSNAQLHLFMQMKRGNVTHMLFCSAEQAEVFLSNMESYYGKEKADRILSSVQIVSTGDSKGFLSGRFQAVSETDSLESFVDSLAQSN
jgi:hypothetical protein